MIFLTIITAYVAAYLLTTDLFAGSHDGSQIDIRLFRSRPHQTVFVPLLVVETWLRGAGTEFHGQIADGASLPLPHP